MILDVGVRFSTTDRRTGWEEILIQKIDTDVGKLVSMIKDGDLRLPEMQRR